MEKKKLYRYTRKDGGVTVATKKPSCEYTLMYRLISDEGKKLTLDGKSLYDTIDVKSMEGWAEVDKPVSTEN